MRAALLAALPLAACALPGGATPRPAGTPPAERAPTSATESPARAPELDHEPILGVLIARAPRVELQLAERARIEGPEGALELGPGSVVLEAAGKGWRRSGETVVRLGDGLLASQGKPLVTVDATPEFGAARSLRLAGDVRIHPIDGALEIIERLPMEAYLASVVGAEMNTRWPTAALAAQAIVARSYAAARWMERSAEPWQLHWHFGVDMAYHGWSPENSAVARAIASTRGEVLMFAGFPVLALFHASSGGRTESFARVKPGVFAPDGHTPIAAAMPVVEDEAALPGAAGLDLSSSHGRWKVDLPLPEVTRALAAWAAAASGRPRFGEVEALSILERHPDSLRVATVSIRHRLEGVTRFTTLAADDFRRAIGPVRVRSLWWERCVIASKSPGYLVLEGRGFGHGCGLSQVSAWYLAREGLSPEAIVARFYAGARIERRY